MRMLLFLLFPALELYLLVKVGSMTGALNMVLWVFASAVIGLWAVRAQGQDAMLKVRADMDAGRVPQNPFLDGLLLFLGGILLILPGLVSDAIGLLLLIPPLRRLAAAKLGRYMVSRQAAGGGASSRIFFFQTGGFPGSRRPETYYDVEPTFTENETVNTDRQRRFTLHDFADRQNDSPRQATVIESKAIDITKSSPDTSNRQNSDASGSKEDDASTHQN